MHAEDSDTESSVVPGVLYVVATPIGHLDDVSRRAVNVLGAVGTIAAEDTRRTQTLLNALGVPRPKLIALHEHNEQAASDTVIERLAAGEAVALVSDAGTPVLSDPGYTLVRRCFEAGVSVRPGSRPECGQSLPCPCARCPCPMSGLPAFCRRNRGSRRSVLRNCWKPVSRWCFSRRRTACGTVCSNFRRSPHSGGCSWPGR